MEYMISIEMKLLGDKEKLVEDLNIFIDKADLSKKKWFNKQCDRKTLEGLVRAVFADDISLDGKDSYAGFFKPTDDREGVIHEAFRAMEMDLDGGSFMRLSLPSEAWPIVLG